MGDFVGAPAAPSTIYQSGKIVKVTGTTAETDLLNLTIKGNSVGTNGALFVTVILAVQPSPGIATTFKLYFGGTLLVSDGPYTPGAPPAKYFTLKIYIVNNGSGAQTAFYLSFNELEFTGSGYNAGITYTASTSIDTTVDQVLRLTCIQGNIADEVDLRYAIIDLLNQVKA